MLTTKTVIRLITMGLLSGGLLFTTLIATTQAAENPRVKIQTNHGDIIVELDQEKAPKSVANFLQYIEDKFYTNTIFHRVMANFMIQGGGFTPTFERKETRPPVSTEFNCDGEKISSTYNLCNEADNGLSNVRGSIAMARTSDPHSASAQFFINVVDNQSLDHTGKTPRGYGYAVFGKVVKGMKVVDTIRNIPTGPGGPFPMNVPKSSAIILGMTYMNKPALAPGIPDASNTPPAAPTAPTVTGN